MFLFVAIGVFQVQMKLKVGNCMEIWRKKHKTESHQDKIRFENRSEHT